MDLHRRIFAWPYRQIVSREMAQSFEPPNQEKRVESLRGAHPVHTKPQKRKQVGRNCPDSWRAHRQYNKKPLELFNEKENLWYEVLDRKKVQKTVWWIKDQVYWMLSRTRCDSFSFLQEGVRIIRGETFETTYLNCQKLKHCLLPWEGQRSPHWKRSRRPKFTDCSTAHRKP